MKNKKARNNRAKPRVDRRRAAPHATERGRQRPAPRARSMEEGADAPTPEFATADPRAGARKATGNGPPPSPPELLAPAGDMPSALAALAAGADALYLGLKHFSARMEAENFSSSELAALTDHAHAENRRIYVAMNTLVKPGEPAQAYRLIRRLAEEAAPDALIVQDLAMLDLARQAGFAGELHLSTLANVTHQLALAAARKAGANRVILPRELSFTEIAMMDEACPPGLELELFVHGALCHCVSGRCWWSSYMGGKSGLRGRCVQPCRRVYARKGREGRFFSCLDLSLGALVSRLLDLPRIRSWKIEGRKKSPHYVYHVTSAYRLLRDERANPDAGKEARRILGLALGRTGTTARFLEARPSPVTAPKGAHTSSGLLVGKISGNREDGYLLRPAIDLLPRDYLRVGYEDEPWHCKLSVPGAVGAGADFAPRLPGGKSPKAGTPVFLIDRKEEELAALIAERTRDLARRRVRGRQRADVAGDEPAMPLPLKTAGRKALEIRLRASLPHGKGGKAGVKPGAAMGLWLSPKALKEVSRTLFDRISWWLPPVIWPDEEPLWRRLVAGALRNGARHFVLNAPWQTGFFSGPEGLALTAGPFCNIANAPALAVLQGMGFAAAVVSPELGGEDVLALPGQSPLPLGIVVSGFWPVGITRHKPEGVKAQEAFASPKGEEFWIRGHGRNTWIYPAWPLDISVHRPALERAGYATFIHMEEHPPADLEPARRVSEFNWKVDVL